MFKLSLGDIVIILETFISQQLCLENNLYKLQTQNHILSLVYASLDLMLGLSFLEILFYSCSHLKKRNEKMKSKKTKTEWSEHESNIQSQG